MDAIVGSDDNPQKIDYSCGQAGCVSPVVRGAIDSVSFGADAFPSNYTQQDIRGVGAYASVSLGAAPATPGTHTAHFSGSSGWYTEAQTSSTFTVAAAPVVNLYFSLVQKLLSVFGA